MFRRKKKHRGPLPGRKIEKIGGVEIEVFDTAELRKKVAALEAGEKLPGVEVPKNLRERLTEWVHFSPGYVLFFFKSLKTMLDIGSFIFMIAGGIIMLMAAWDIFTNFDANRWEQMIKAKEIYIVIGYFLIMFVISKIRFLLFRIVEWC